MAGEVGFIELGVADAERGRAFYQGLFPDWRLSPGPNEQGFEVQGAGVPAGLHGGDKGAGPYVFFVVDDIDAAAQRVRELGGAVEDVDIEGDADSTRRFGRFKLCRDDQGSAFGLHQRPAG
jgi:predicted enzyme related to lactoylglutathione lyase